MRGDIGRRARREADDHANGPRWKILGAPLRNGGERRERQGEAEYENALHGLPPSLAVCAAGRAGAGCRQADLAAFALFLRPILSEHMPRSDVASRRKRGAASAGQDIPS